MDLKDSVEVNNAHINPADQKTNQSEISLNKTELQDCKNEYVNEITKSLAKYKIVSIVLGGSTAFFLAVSLVFLYFKIRN